jgi:hypothetical protein
MKLRHANHFKARAAELDPSVKVEVVVNYGDEDNVSVKVTLPTCREMEYWHGPDAFRYLDGWLRRNEFIG